MTEEELEVRGCLGAALILAIIAGLALCGLLVLIGPVK